MENQGEGKQPVDASTPILAAAAPASKFRRFRTGRKKGFIIVAIILFALLLLTGVFIKNKDSGERAADGNARTAVCTEDFNQQARPAFDPERNEELDSLVAFIEAQKDYKTDPNCLYIVLTHSLGNSDAQKARETFDLMQQATNDQNQLSPDFTGYLGVAELEQSVIFLEEVAKAANDNIQTFSTPEELR